MPDRTFSRVPFNLEATITYNDTVVEGDLENISLKGVFVRTPRKIPLHDTVVVIIYHRKKNEICRLRANVVRATPEGVALEFEKTLLDS